MGYLKERYLIFFIQAAENYHKDSKVIPIGDVEQVSFPPVLLNDLQFHVIGFVGDLDTRYGTVVDMLIVNDDFGDGSFKGLGRCFGFPDLVEVNSACNFVHYHIQDVVDCL